VQHKQKMLLLPSSKLSCSFTSNWTYSIY